MDKVFGGAVIGFGGMGSWHANRIKSAQGIELIGVYDIDPERHEAARKDEIYTFSSREELLADDRIGLVTIATPNDVHKEIAIAAMAAGKNVICEKPVTLSSKDLEEMLGAAEKYGVLFTVHQNRRWDGDYLTVKKIYEDNTLGRIYNIESRVQGSRGIPGDWRGIKKYGGGMVLDWGVHLLDQALTIMGDKKLVSVYATTTHITNDEVDDGFRATLNFGDVNYYVEVTTNDFVELPRWFVLGENGSAVIENWDIEGRIVKVKDWENYDVTPIQAGAGITKTMAPRTSKTIKKYPLPKVHSDWGEFYRNVIACINGEENIIVTHKQIRRCMKLIEAIFESAKTNSVVPFEE
ncbi:MAG: Gfo/Idh/MocA family oxidoreductase [Clostridiales bacterium]|nr:Gfo/Idh/MocA family oxidoreductase [Clostridiales bacterium]